MEELNAIYERMRAIFAEEAGFVPNDGCDAMVRLYALASEVLSLLAQADWVLDQSFPQTAVGQSADDLAPGEVRIRSAAAGTEIVLRNNGRIDINGALYINGMPYLGMGG